MSILSPTNWVTALFVSPTNIEITWSLLDISLSLPVITDWSSSAASTAASSLIWSSVTSTMCQECQKYPGHHLQSCYKWSSICGFVSPSKIQCIQASITLRASVLTQIYDQVIWQAHLVWQYSWQRVTALIKVLPPNSNSFVCLGNWSQEHLKAHRNKYQLIIDVNHTVCGGVWQ